jgi:hypothetical protein
MDTDEKLDLILKNQLFIIEQLKYFRQSLDKDYTANWEDERINFIKDLFGISCCDHLHQKWVGDHDKNPQRKCVDCNEILNKKETPVGDHIIPNSQVWWHP